MKNPFKPYSDQFSESGFWEKISQFAKMAGIKVVYSALLLFYAFRRKETPSWAKTIILGVLGYFLAPIDGIPDLTPVIGYTDDLGVLTFGLVTIAAYVNQDVKEKARNRLTAWFSSIEENQLSDVDKHF